jgi:hypothetical protein
MENVYKFKIKKWINFLEKKFIHFVNVETEPRLGKVTIKTLRAYSGIKRVLYFKFQENY